jgi:hypothetical protein
MRTSALDAGSLYVNEEEFRDTATSTSSAEKRNDGIGIAFWLDCLADEIGPELSATSRSGSSKVWIGVWEIVTGFSSSEAVIASPGTVTLSTSASVPTESMNCLAISSAVSGDNSVFSIPFCLWFDKGWGG